MRPQRAGSLTQGLVGVWCPSLGATGFRLQDRSGRNNHGTLTNMASTAWQTTVGKLSLNYNGFNTYVLTSTPASGAFPLGSSARTMACWFRGPNAGIGGQQIMAYGGNGGGGQRFGFWHTSTTTIGVEITGTISSIPITRNNDFRLLVATMDGASNNINSVKIYLDGIEGSAYTITGSSTIDTRNTGMSFGTISGAPNNGNFLGQIDDARIYNRALTAPEIRQLYVGGRGFGLLPERPRRRGTAAAGFRAYWARRQSQLIGGGL